MVATSGSRVRAERGVNATSRPRCKEAEGRSHDHQAPIRAKMISRARRYTQPACRTRRGAFPDSGSQGNADGNLSSPRTKPSRSHVAIFACWTTRHATRPVPHPQPICAISSKSGGAQRANNRNEWRPKWVFIRTCFGRQFSAGGRRCALAHIQPAAFRLQTQARL